MFRYLASTYAQNHPEMKTGHNCEEVFPDGITNGAHWYELNGGMQGKFMDIDMASFGLGLQLMLSLSLSQFVHSFGRFQLREHKLL